MAIHPTAIVDRRCEIDATADVGPYAVVEAGVRIGAGTRLWHHAFVAQGTTLGARCQIHPFAVVGHEPQDLAWKGAPSYTVVGDETIVRESGSIHRGTMPESTTRVGSRVFIMTCGHVGHNCVVGDDVKLANGAALAGHVHVGDKSFISSFAGVHQFARIGELVMLSGLTRVPCDIPPFMMVTPLGVSGINVIGMRRAGIGAADRAEIRAAYRTLFRSGWTRARALAELESRLVTPSGLRLLEFLRAPSKRGMMRYHGALAAETEESEAD